MHECIGLVARLNELAELTILFRMRLGVLDHALDLVVRQTARCLDHNLLFFARCLVSS